MCSGAILGKELGIYHITHCGLLFNKKSTMDVKSKFIVFMDLVFDGDIQCEIKDSGIQLNLMDLGIRTLSYHDYQY